MEARRYPPEYYLCDAGVPKRYRSVSAANFTTPLPQMNDHGLFISGPAGHGKTVMATAVMRENLDEGLWLNTNMFPPTYQFSGLWIAAPELFLTIRGTYGKKGVSELDVVRKYTTVSLLVLDDICAEKGTDWSLSALYTILMVRINECRKTIVTSNLSRKEIDALDPRLGSRIGGMTPHVLKTRDWRKVAMR